MRQPRLSIVIATYDACSTLERCLESVVAQRFQDRELLVVDGGSGDATTGIIRRYEAMLSYWHSEADNGMYDAWNKALRHARGDYVCFLGADDAFADSEALSRLFDAVGTDTPDLVTSRGRMHLGRAGRYALIGGPWNYDRLGRHSVVCHTGLLHRRTLFERYGHFNTSYAIASDLDFLLRLPRDLETVHVDAVTTEIGNAGISRRQVMKRLREQREILARCPRYGPLRANLAWLDKVWRYPVARLLDIPH